MKNLLLGFCVVVLVFSCKSEDCCTPCNVKNPIEDLAWLKSNIELREKNKGDYSKYFYIQQGKYKNQVVFIDNNCCPLCDAIIPVYNCNGDSLFLLNDQNKEITDVKIIWSPSEFDCSSIIVD